MDTAENWMGFSVPVGCTSEKRVERNFSHIGINVGRVTVHTLIASTIGNILSNYK
jgi:hypothetical protein